MVTRLRSIRKQLRALIIGLTYITNGHTSQDIWEMTLHWVKNTNFSCPMLSLPHLQKTKIRANLIILCSETMASFLSPTMFIQSCMVSSVRRKRQACHPEIAFLSYLGTYECNSRSSLLMSAKKRGVVVTDNNVDLISETYEEHCENCKFVDFNHSTPLWRQFSEKRVRTSTNNLYCQKLVID